MVKVSSAEGQFLWHRSLLIRQELVVWEKEEENSWFDGGWRLGPQKKLGLAALSLAGAAEECGSGGR